MEMHVEHGGVNSGNDSLGDVLRCKRKTNLRSPIM